MPLKMSPDDRKAAVRAELIKQAQAGQTITYKGLGIAINGPARGPWKRVLDAIRAEELAESRPDLTSIVISSITRFPSYISNDVESQNASMRERRKVFEYYGT